MPRHVALLCTHVCSPVLVPKVFNLGFHLPDGLRNTEGVQFLSNGDVHFLVAFGTTQIRQVVLPYSYQCIGLAFKPLRAQRKCFI